jgi:hypothetical protein
MSFVFIGAEVVYRRGIDIIKTGLDDYLLPKRFD